MELNLNRRCSNDFGVVGARAARVSVWGVKRKAVDANHSLAASVNQKGALNETR